MNLSTLTLTIILLAVIVLPNSFAYGGYVPSVCDYPWMPDIFHQRTTVELNNTICISNNYCDCHKWNFGKVKYHEKAIGITHWW